MCVHSKPYGWPGKDFSRDELKEIALIAAVDHAQRFPRAQTEACEVYNVSRQTLIRRLKDKHEGYKTPGPPAFLEELEPVLVEWIDALERDRRPPQLLPESLRRVRWQRPAALVAAPVMIAL